MKTLIFSLLLLAACAPEGTFKDGKNGNSCSVAETDFGAVVSCTDGTTANLNHGLNGLNGANGIDGVNGIDGIDGADGTDAEIEVVTLCPDLAGAFPEVLFRINEKLYAVYSQGNKIHLTLLTPNNYVTTDGRSCSFTVTAYNQVVY